MAYTRIVKVQKPVYPPDGAWLAYDEAQVHSVPFWPDEWLREAMGGRMKAYFTATWSDESGWIFKRRVKEVLHW